QEQHERQREIKIGGLVEHEGRIAVAAIQFGHPARIPMADREIAGEFLREIHVAEHTVQMRVPARRAGEVIAIGRGHACKTEADEECRCEGGACLSEGPHRLRSALHQETSYFPLWAEKSALYLRE